MKAGFPSEPFYEPLMKLENGCIRAIGRTILSSFARGDVAALAPTVHGATTAHGFFERLEAVRLSELTDQTALFRAIGVYVSQAIARFERRHNYPIDVLLKL